MSESRIVLLSHLGVSVEVREDGVDALLAAGFTREAQEPEKRPSRRKASSEKD